METIENVAIDHIGIPNEFIYRVSLCTLLFLVMLLIFVVP